MSRYESPLVSPLRTSLTSSGLRPMDAEQIPYTQENRPDPVVVDFTRAALERNRKRQNERGRMRQPRLPEPPEAA